MARRSASTANTAVRSQTTCRTGSSNRLPEKAQAKHFGAHLKKTSKENSSGSYRFPGSGRRDNKSKFRDAEVDEQGYLVVKKGNANGNELPEIGASRGHNSKHGVTHAEKVAKSASKTAKQNSSVKEINGKLRVLKPRFKYSDDGSV